MRRAVIAALASTLIAASTAKASPSQDLEEARHDFRAKDCTSVKRTLSYLLYPEKLAGRDDLVDAHAMLGACYFDTGDRDNARTQFEALLQLLPTKTLDNLIYSAGAVHLFDETKADMEARAKLYAEQHKVELDKAALEARLKSLVVVVPHPYYVNFVPFGAGQFQEEHTTRGYFFASAEAVTLAASFGVWAYLVGKYGLVSKNVPLTNAPGVLRLQGIELGSGIAFFGFYALGVIDSLRNYKRNEREVATDKSLLDDPDAKPAPKPTRPVSLLDRIHFEPMVVPGGAGLGIGWEN